MIKDVPLEVVVDTDSFVEKFMNAIKPLIEQVNEQAQRIEELENRVIDIFDMLIGDGK